MIKLLLRACTTVMNSIYVFLKRSSLCSHVGVVAHLTAHDLAREWSREWSGEWAREWSREWAREWARELTGTYPI